MPSRCSPDICGNGLRNTLAEECDDGNLIDGDGCSSVCKIEEELGWKCSGGGLKSRDNCFTICGDGFLVQSLEECDDNNKVDGDGCS